MTGENDFLETLSQNEQKMDSVYDLAAFCYNYIMEKKGDMPDSEFIGIYVKKGSDPQKNNPNFSMLKTLEEQFFAVLMNAWDQKTPLWEILAQYKALVSMTFQKLKPYGRDTPNKLAPVFFSISAIDRYIGENKQQNIRQSQHQYGGTYVYKNVVNNIIDTAAEKCRFHEPISSYSIKNQFRYLLIIERNVYNKKAAPQVKKLFTNSRKPVLAEIEQEKKLKVAIIPFGNQSTVQFVQGDGGLFRVEYEQAHQKQEADGAERLLQEAAAAGANVVVFPEYVCHHEIQERIQKCLKEADKKRRGSFQKLLLVVAGSEWAEDNNVCTLYSYSGKQIGRQYKSESFKGEIGIEGLTRPGAETTILEIDGIGRVLVGICKDIVVQESSSYMKNLANIFKPQFFFVPAWSKSVTIAFREQLREISTDNHVTVSVVCNCCKALEGKVNSDESENIGYVVYPVKDRSTVMGQTNDITRNRSCISKCSQNGCFYMINLDFSIEAVKKKRIAESISQIKVAF